MTYLPFSNRFEKIFSESKELTSTWKIYEVEIRKVAGVISEYDRQIEAIRRACKKGGEIHEYCPDLEQNLIGKIFIKREESAAKFDQLLAHMTKAVTDFEEKMNDLRQNLIDGHAIEETPVNSRKKELDPDLFDKVNFSDFEIFSFLMNFNSNGLRRIAELKTLHSNNEYTMVDTVFENAISVPIL